MIPSSILPFCAAAATLAAALATQPAAAHSPIMACYDNGDETVTCEAGFSDGASAAGAIITVMTSEQRAVERGKVSQDGTFTFPLPEDAEIEIHFSSDSTHTLTLFGDEVVPFEE